jgi:thiol:disulfide interchange protein DsbA
MLKKMWWVMAALFALGAQAQVSYVEGTHFVRLPKPVPVSTGERIEVLEIFSYACVHCFEMEPHLSRWKASNPPKAQLKLLPLGGSAAWTLVARAYYTAEVLKLSEKTHRAFFQEIFEKRTVFDSPEKVADFYAKHGADRAKFLSTFNSFGINTKLNKGNALAQSVGVDTTPSIIIDGKFRLVIDRPALASFADVGPLINFVVEKASQERTAK